MLISELSQSYLVLYGFLTLIWVVAITLSNVINEADMGWSIDEDDYFNVARGAGLVGLLASAFYLVGLTLNVVAGSKNSSITFSWDIAWVAPAATIIGTILAPVLSLVLTKIFKLTFSTTGTITKTLKMILHAWCYALSRIGARKK